MNNQIKIKIEGEIAKNQSLPIDFFVTLSKNLQNLISNIARYDVPSDKNIDLKNFKLDLVDFKKGSAIPVFQYSNDGEENLFTTIEEQREIVNTKLNNIFEISTNDKYEKLIEVYPEPEKRIAIVSELYNFVSNLKGNKATISFNDDKSYRIKNFKKETKDYLIPINSNEEDELKEIQFAKVEVSKKNKKYKTKIIEMYDKRFKNIDYAPEYIETENYYYKFKFPLNCKIDKKDQTFTLENDTIGIYSFGRSEDEAEINFNEEFDYIFKRYNEIDDKNLTEDVKFIKLYLNNLILEHGELKS